MIKKIESIKEFGIYKNFNWATSLDIKNFNHKNLFYGWNYSGKTTLSRIFSSLRDKKIHEGYEKGKFKIKTSDGDFDSSDLELFPYDLLVFNSDYIKDNLNFSIHKDDISDSKTILFEVGENVKHQTKINNLQAEIDSINGTESIIGKKDKFLDEIEEFGIYDKPNSGKFTLLAREIKNQHFDSIIDFTKTNLKHIIPKVKESLSTHIIRNNKQLARLRVIVITKEPRDELDEIQINFSYSEIIEKTNKILSSIPDKNKLDKILDKNTEAYSWVKKGQELNKANNKCLFCGNIINEDRIRFLTKYFNSQAANLKEDVDVVRQLIFEEQNKIKTINIPSSSNDFNLGYIDEYKVLKKQFDKITGSYKKHLNLILSKLDNKLNKSLYLSVNNVLDFKNVDVINSIKQINEHIIKNNDFTKGFQHRIESERTFYKNHLVASFLKSEKYNLKEKKYKNALVEVEKLNTRIQEIDKEILFYESKKFSDEEGALQYTYFIQSFLNREDIEIKLDHATKQFKLLRNNENASNLSEGEKTAIAFSHFLVSIKAIESKGKFKDYIIFVDDPISSLDGNHVFQINSLLKEVFFTNDNPGNEWKLKCNQLFLSTHNFEFFNLMRELPMDKPNKESKYYIERSFVDNTATIKPLPLILDKFKSEYHYLFKEIFDFSILRKPLKSEKLLLIPNILRRFLEMYTLTKYPSTDNVDRRADKIFTSEISKRICKPFHYFSHFNNIDRIGKQSEFVADIPVACKELIKQIKKDKLHFEALKNAVNK
ncbi:MAG: AAA family ATPase [Bacteroidales bacterium]|nr:AAA family ATPase [Bacteroidales bacterium]